MQVLGGPPYIAATPAHFKTLRVLNNGGNQAVVTYGPGRAGVISAVMARITLGPMESFTDDSGPILGSGYGLFVQAVGTYPDLTASASGMEL